jgi:hypothetical protein
VKDSENWNNANLKGYYEINGEPIQRLSGASGGSVADVIYKMRLF